MPDMTFLSLTRKNEALKYRVKAAQDFLTQAGITP
jgi:hypothetical protein